MGTNRRPKPALLAGKLLEIRTKLGLTQDELVERLGLEDEFDQERISKFERGKLEPPLHVLCAYADVANILLDVLGEYVEEAKDKRTKGRKGLRGGK